jgi:hypothetical protein
MIDKSFHNGLHGKDASEKGTVMLVFAFFILTMVPLLALSIDTFFMSQGRLEEQNLAEYAALTTLDGYVRGINHVSPEHGQCKANSLVFLKDMEGKNGVTGLTTGTPWNFSPTSCVGNQCSGSGWTAIFGSWDQLNSVFTPAPTDMPMDPESINPELVNAVKFSMVIPDNGFVDYFRSMVMGSGSGENVNSGVQEGENHHHEVGAGNDTMKLPVTAVAYFAQEGSLKYFRLTRVKASGSDSI